MLRKWYRRGSTWYHFRNIKLLIKKRSDRLKNRSKSPVKIQLSLGRFSIKIPNFGKIFLDFLSNLCRGDPSSSSRELSLPMVCDSRFFCGGWRVSYWGDFLLITCSKSMSYLLLTS